MKTKFLSLILVIVVAMLALLIVSCGDDVDKTEIETQGLLAENGIYKITVPNSISSYDILSKVTINEDAQCVLSKDKEFAVTLGDGAVDLEQGNNTIYLKVTDDNENETVYTFNIYRKKMVTVTYNVNGGSMANSTTTVEEGTVISAPTADKAGHSLSWDYDFSKPVTEDITINAVWTANNCAILANVDGNVTRYELTFGGVSDEIVAPTKFGYDFAGWKYGEVDFDPTKPYYYSENEIEIIATFKPIEFKVQYVVDKDAVTNNPNNVSFFTIVTENGEELYISLLAPTHASSNYYFIGWYTDIELNSAIQAIDMDIVNGLGADNTLVLYPKWEIKSNIVYDANNGTCDESEDLFTVGTAYDLPVPTRENYIFDGWYNGEAKIANTGIWTLTEDVNLVAKWTPRQNDIEYNLGYTEATNNSGNPSTFDVEDGEIELLAPTYDDKHSFAGWYTSPNFEEDTKVTHISSAMAGADVTLYAKWNILVDVMFDLVGGECDYNSAQLTLGQDYTLPVPTKNKYIFSGWYNGNDSVSLNGTWSIEADTTLVAKWTPKEYKIVYVLNGGTNNESNPKEYTIESTVEELTLNAPIKDYNKFLGWYLDDNYETSITVIDSSLYEGITLYAKWEAITVTINYNADGGTVSKENEVLNLGDSYSLPIPVKPGYNFDGWYFGETLVKNKGKLTDENLVTLDLVAKWTLVEYEIVYDLDGGSDEGVTLVKKYTVLTEDFQLPAITKEGYYFVGWASDDSEASASVVITKGSTGNRSFKAIWTAQKDSNGLLYSLIDGKMVVVGIERTIDATIKNGIKIPATFNGVEVVAIESNAFKAFGEEFTKTEYANMSSSYVNFYVPTSIKRVGANAFATCNGIKVTLYDPNNSYADYEEWDKTVTWEAGNTSARDCIWGFRPAIGWTRYSKVEIPDDYE